MLRLLSLETATDRGAFALWSGQIIDSQVLTDTCHPFDCPSGQSHAETLLPALRSGLTAVGWSLSSLDGIVFDSGPGMFTGLRVSAALAQGLAVGLNKPIIGICSLEVLAQSAFEATGSSCVLTLIDARMNQLYGGVWVKNGFGWNAEYPPQLLNPDDVENWGPFPKHCTVAGTGIREYAAVDNWIKNQGIKDSGIYYPRADSMARLAALRFHSGVSLDASQAIPVYVRDRVALTTAQRAAGEVL